MSTNAIPLPTLTCLDLVRLCAEYSDAPVHLAEQRLQRFASKVMGADDVADLDEVCRREVARLIRSGVIRAQGFDF